MRGKQRSRGESELRAGEGRVRPAAPFMQKIRVGLRPHRGRPGPLRPPPDRLSTQVLFPAVTRRTKCPPGASNKNCAMDLTVHFKGASRAHGPGREVQEPHPGQPSALLRPFGGGPEVHTPLLPRPAPARPLLWPRAQLPGAPGPAEHSWKPLSRDRASDPTFYSRALRWGGGCLGLQVAPESIAIGGLFLFPGSRAVTELPGPYQSAAGSSRLPRAGHPEPVIPPRQSQRRSAGPRGPP